MSLSINHLPLLLKSQITKYFPWKDRTAYVCMYTWQKWGGGGEDGQERTTIVTGEWKRKETASTHILFSLWVTEK